MAILEPDKKKFLQQAEGSEKIEHWNKTILFILSLTKWEYFFIIDNYVNYIEYSIIMFRNCCRSNTLSWFHLIDRYDNLYRLWLLYLCCESAMRPNYFDFKLNAIWVICEGHNLSVSKEVIMTQVLKRISEKEENSCNGYHIRYMISHIHM